ncbi:MAG: hypothetical protein KTR16_14730 [Acidiferrobacterales bacterium]|nr:hypothetical protein [Acidiferrobacterales bacterium]
MQLSQPDILKTLQNAQLAHKSGDFVTALEFYQYFFNHALDDDPYALYGVRLSYCLDGWAKLAELFPKAKLRLQEQQEESLCEYRETNNKEKFHDFYCICKAQNQQQEALKIFIEEYQENSKRAERLAKYVWEDLVLIENWHLCGLLLKQPEQKLDELFAIFDEGQQLKSVEPEFNTNNFDQHLIESLIKGTADIVQTLRFNNRSEEIHALQKLFAKEVEIRNDSSLSKAIHAQASFLFLGH